MAEAGKSTEPGGPRAAATAAVAAWEQANPQLIAGMTAVQEVVVAGDLVAASDQDLWPGPLPPDLKTAIDPASLSGLVAAADYLAASRGPAQRWAERLSGCRAALLPDRALVGDGDRAPLREFVASGGMLIAFGHASLLDADAKPRRDYLLADLFGAHYDGLVQPDAESARVTVTADTTYAPQFPPENVIDGAPETFWASIEAGPMPHWVQITFSRPRTLARADVACRPGFLLQDFEVQYQQGDEWRPAAKVTGNEEWVIRCDFARPVETSALRLFITKESLNGADRVIADAGEFTPYDEKSRPIIAPPNLIVARLTDPAWAKAAHSDRLVLRSPALRLRPDGAKVLASFPGPGAGEGELPLCTQHKVGKGRAVLFAVPEGALGGETYAWEGLLRLFVGMPSLRHSGDESVFAFLSRARDRYLLHVVDGAPSDIAERAREVIVRLNTRALGPISTAALLPDETTVSLSKREAWLQLTAPMSPIASLLLRRTR